MALKCRNCGASAGLEMVDLGMSPLCESFVPVEKVDDPEVFYPLRVMVCEACYLAQLDEFATPDDIFSEYAYFSSYSDSWLDHARRYSHEMISRFSLDSGSQVVEVASNDGYLLRWFKEAGVPVLGIEPAANVAQVALDLGVPTNVEFFGQACAAALRGRGVSADLLVGNNVLAQVPDLHDFVAGLKELLAAEGVITLEFPHLLRLIEEDQFDTIYHEHFSYFSLSTCADVFSRHDLELFDVERIPTHGGSLRVYLHHAGDRTHAVRTSVGEVLEEEAQHGLLEPETYTAFGRRAIEVKHQLLSMLIDIKGRGETIAGYGAAGKGNTLLNYCGIRTDFLDFIADRNPYKIGRYTPGTHIPITGPEAIAERKPRHVLILPWNLESEIRSQLSYVAEWGGDFIVPIPRVTIKSAQGVE